MNISLNWLKQHVELPKNIDPNELGLKLTMATVEVDAIHNLGELLDNIIVAKVVSIKEHPNADKLRLAIVSDGKKEYNVVCGGTNLKENMLVSYAMPGAKVHWHGEGELVTLEIAKVRGEKSEGMICASDEIGLADLFIHGDDEILDLSEQKLKVGLPLAEALGLDDVIYEIDNKSLTNRPDLWGHYGIAREVAAIYGVRLKAYKINKIKTEKQVDLKVKIAEQKKCSRYIGVVLKNVKVGESPAWLKQFLQSIGQKSINNIVDITNFVMYDLGQPLHAFSADKIKDNQIIVRNAISDEKVVTLDGEEHGLTEEDLVISDSEKAVAIAGVMGNANSEITDNTELVILEAACFDPTSIRKTANRLDLRTESAIRFEKNLDPNLAELAIKRAVNLIQELIPQAEVVSEFIEAKNFQLDQGPIKISWDFINKRIGQELGKSKIKSILKGLGFELKDTKDGLKITIPTWRATKDISIKEDIIEEISRVYGYDNLTPVMPEVNMSVPEENALRGLERKVKEILSLNAGANEVYNYSFVNKDFLQKIGQPIDHVELENPWVEGENYMRKSLIPNLLQNVVENLRFFENINIFEIGKVFIDNNEGEKIEQNSKMRLPAQPVMAAGAYLAKGKEQAFASAKGILEALFETLRMEANYEVFVGEEFCCHPKQSLQIFIGKEPIGYIANLHPRISSELEIKDQLVIWNINLNKILEHYPVSAKYQSLEKFPAIELDLAIIVDEKTTWKDIQNLVKTVEPDLITRARLFDVYKGDKIEVGKKSLAFRITYQSKDRTLEMEEVNKLQEKVISQLKKAVGAVVRNT